MPQILLDAYKQGFKASFRYDPYLVDQIKKCLGFQWNKELKFWWSAGPEVLIDMERYQVPFRATSVAQERIDDFRKRLYVIAQLKNTEIEGQFGYQTIGTHLLVTQRRAILADDMGLGKSKQALDALALVWPRIRNRRCLVVAPKTLTYNWYDPESPETEFTKWHPELPVFQVPEGGPKKRAPFWEDLLERDEFVLITNYEKTLLRDFPDLEFEVVIADEATKLKNSRSQIWERMETFTGDATYVWALTGTPLEIRLEELYNLMKLVRPAVFGPFSRFAQQHLMQDLNGLTLGSKNHDLLKMRYGPWITRRTKKEVAPWLPPRLPRILHYIEMDETEKKLYEQLCQDFDDWKEENPGANTFNALVEQVRLQQFCCSPDILDIGEGIKGTKFEELERIIAEWDGLIAVFTQYREAGKRIHEWLGCHEDAYIHGNQGKEAVRRGYAFSRGDLGKVLISTDAGAYGLNIVGADLCIHFDQTWNPQKHNQRVGRLDRTGQTKPVNEIYLLYRNTIDHGKRLVLDEREDLFSDVVDDVESFTKLKLSITDLSKLARGQFKR